MSNEPKTFRQLYEMMDEPERSQAIENCEKQCYALVDEIPSSENTIEEALGSGFMWKESPQGYDYWFDIQYKYSDR